MRALVTGASRGIGAATARSLAARGYDLALHAHHHPAEATSLANEIRAHGHEAIVVGGDLAHLNGVSVLVEGLRSRWDSLDVIVQNAGAYPRRPFEELDATAWQEILQLHLMSPALLTRELLPQLRASTQGRVIFVASVLALNGSRHGAHYAAAKAGVLGLMRSLAHELAPSITVNAVAPGTIDTDVVADDTAEQRAARAATIPLARIGRPEEVAEAIAFLASSEASYITGTTLHVNGGLRME